MSTLDILMAAAGAAASMPLIVSDVFSTSLYTGNSSTQTITNGIDLAGNGGMVWIKLRDSTTSNFITDTLRGATNTLLSNNTTANAIVSNALTAFNSSGFSVGSGPAVNYSTGNHVAWTFRKAPKFFDVVTYTGDGVAGRQIPHSLGVKPGMIIVKATSTVKDWYVWHRSLSNEVSSYLVLNSTAAVGSYNMWHTPPDANNFYVNSSTETNGSGITYVAYIFAHDSSADGVIQCGSFTTDASGNASINLGYRPQFVLFKLTSTSSNWVITDSARGMPTGTGDKVLVANLVDSEITTSIIDTSSTGFSLTGLPANATGIYMAIKSAV